MAHTRTRQRWINLGERAFALLGQVAPEQSWQDALDMLMGWATEADLEAIPAVRLSDRALDPARADGQPLHHGRISAASATMIDNLGPAAWTAFGRKPTLGEVVEFAAELWLKAHS